MSTIAPVGEEHDRVGVGGGDGVVGDHDDGLIEPVDGLAQEDRISLPVRVSSAPVGSSAKITSGRVTSARAIATRCCWPPESSAGLVLDSVVEPDALDHLGSQAWSGFRFGEPQGSVMFWAAVREGRG